MVSWRRWSGRHLRSLVDGHEIVRILRRFQTNVATNYIRLLTVVYNIYIYIEFRHTNKRLILFLSWDAAEMNLKLPGEGGDPRGTPWDRFGRAKGALWMSEALKVWIICNKSHQKHPQTQVSTRWNRHILESPANWSKTSTVQPWFSFSAMAVSKCFFLAREKSKWASCSVSGHPSDTPGVPVDDLGTRFSDQPTGPTAYFSDTVVYLELWWTLQPGSWGSPN